MAFAGLSTVYPDDGSLINARPLIKANRNGPIVLVSIDHVAPGDVSLWLVIGEKLTEAE